MTTISDGRRESRRTTRESRSHEHGILNNLAKETAMYCAEASSSQEQRCLLPRNYPRLFLR